MAETAVAVNPDGAGGSTVIVTLSLTSVQPFASATVAVYERVAAGTNWRSIDELLVVAVVPSHHVTVRGEAPVRLTRSVAGEP